MIHADETNPVPKGFVVANDVDNNIDERLSSLKILITNHDFSVMPNFKVTNPGVLLNSTEFLPTFRAAATAP
uniref:Uncharacterized protein n=1 Tax=Bracon brevicornis TaxID=1563983 RepID=A0A6V7J7G5_9HYME